jgi:uncharacterized membrane protein YeaQ/YmgE (transglycosylase-associated protein family)
MLDLLGWDVGMSLFAAILLIAGALLIGVLASMIGEVRVGWEWAATAGAALVGGYLGSEALGTASTWGPVFEGLYIVPAIIGGLVLGVFVDALSRYSTAGSYVRHETRPI